MTLPDFDAHDWSAFPYAVVRMTDELPPDERAAVLAIVEAEPFSFSAQPVVGQPGVVDVAVGRECRHVGRFHVGAIRGDGATCN